MTSAATWQPGDLVSQDIVDAWPTYNAQTLRDGFTFMCCHVARQDTKAWIADYILGFATLSACLVADHGVKHADRRDAAHTFWLIFTGFVEDMGKAPSRDHVVAVMRVTRPEYFEEENTHD